MSIPGHKEEAPGSWLPENVGDYGLKWRKESGENIIEER